MSLRDLYVQCMDFLLYDERALTLLAVVLTVSFILALYQYANTIARKK